jgi:hypothetical protein
MNTIKEGNMKIAAATVLAIGMVLALFILGKQLSGALDDMQTWDRVVTVKGLSEKEVLADHVIWPIQFVEASNDLKALYTNVKANGDKVTAFLLTQGLDAQEITTGNPEVTDKLAQQYGSNTNAPFRYNAIQTITVYSKNVEKVRTAMQQLVSLLNDGVVLSQARYEAQPEYVFSGLNEFKPVMIEEATLNAREVALKFAKDSKSTLGKIKRANQGRFSISSRDAHHPHIKKIRVVSTIDYTLID